MARSQLLLTEMRSQLSDDSLVNESNDLNADLHAIVAEEDIGQFYRLTREFSLDHQMQRYDSGHLQGTLRMTERTL